MRKRLFITALLICAFVLQAFVFSVYADGELKLNAELGYDGFYRIGSTIPVFFEIENNLKDINGELQVELPDEYDNIVLYAININLPQNTTKEFVMYVPITRVSSKIKINIVEGKNVVMTKTIRPSTTYASDTLVIGVLSDDYESVKYIDKIPLRSNAIFKTQSVKLNEHNFPNDIEALRMFSVILLNNFDTSKLEEGQYACLKKWVNEGGILLIGTGPSYTKTLAVFKDDFINGQIGNVQTVGTAALSEFVSGTAGEAMAIKALELQLKDAVALASEGEINLLQKVEKGKGVIAVASFDFGLEPVAGWVGNKSFSEALLGRVMPSFYNSAYFEKQVYAYNNLYAIDNSLRTIPELEQPNPIRLLIIFAAYILIAAPVSYLILKKLDKRGYMWITVPVLAVIFSAVIYYSGYGTRLTKPIMNVISMVDIDESGKAIPKTYAGVFTPNKSNMKIEAEKGTLLKPLNINSGYMYGMPQQEDAPKKVVSKITLAPETSLEFYKAGVWSLKNISIETDKSLEGKLEAKLNYSNKRVTGTVTNNSIFDLNECFLITSNQFIPIGAVKSGETVQVDQTMQTYYGNRYDLMNAIYKDPYSSGVQQSKLTRQEIREIRENMQKRQILDYYFWGEDIGGSSAKLIGWSDTSISGDIRVNGQSVDKFEKSFIATNVSLEFRQGDQVDYPMGYIRPIINNLNMMQGSYDEMGKMLYGTGSAEVRFELDPNVVPEEVTVLTSGATMNVKKFVWNIEKQDWEATTGDMFKINEENIKKYVSKDNRLLLRYELTEDNMPLPQISMKGSVK